MFAGVIERAGLHVDVDAGPTHEIGVGTLEHIAAQGIREITMIDIIRSDGKTHDIFDVDPSGVGWHTVVVTGVGITNNDKLPGFWARFLHAEWSADGKTLTAFGRGWMNGQGGTTFSVYWNGGAWKGPQGPLP